MSRKRSSVPKASTPALASPAASHSGRNTPPWLCAAIFGAVLLAYLPALQGGFLWDDDGHVTIPALRSLAGLGRIWFEPGATQQYYPVLHSAFWFEHRLWGDSVLGYHLVNVFLHAGSACMIGLLLRRLAVPGAWFAAAIFALHPVHVESVAWISEQKNTLSTFFYLVAAFVYLGFDEQRDGRSYAASLVLFIFALLAKSVTATLPAALLVVIWWRRGRLEWKRDAVPLAPWLVAGASAGLVTAWVERHLIGASGADFELGGWERVLLAARAPWFYFGKLVWPVDLAFVYPRWTLLEPTSYLAMAATIIAAIVGWRGRRKWRGTLAAVLFFTGSLFPVLGFFNLYPFIYSFVADHWQYLASIGIIALLGAAAARGFERLPVIHRRIGRAAGGGALLVLALLTARESRGYRDAETFYQTIIAKNPGAWLACNNLGAHFVARGQLERALPLFHEALRLKPAYAQARANLGSALVNLGRFTEAAPYLEAALRAADLRRTPMQVVAQANWAAVLVNGGRYAEAIPILKAALQTAPHVADTHNTLGYALARTGRSAEAQAAFETALRLRPDYAIAYLNLAELLAQNNQPADAVGHYESALRLAPDTADAQRDFAALLLFLNRPQEAIAHGEVAVRLAPQSASSHRVLADALVRANRPADAISHFEAALRFHPGYEGVHTDLAGALIQLGRLADAFQQCEAALRAKPGDALALRYLEQIRTARRSR